MSPAFFLFAGIVRLPTSSSVPPRRDSLSSAAGVPPPEERVLLDAQGVGILHFLYMETLRYTPIEENMKTYIVQFELAEEEDGRWSAWVPALPGCATWGSTKEEAVHNIHDAVEAYLADMRKAGDEIPQGAITQVINEPAVAVTV